MAIQFTKATKKNARLRLALCGPAGSGKTYTLLKLATEMGGRIAAVDTERGSMGLYSDEFDFDSFEPETYDPQFAIDAISSAAAQKYNVIIIDSLSHFWQGIGGELEKVDQAAKKLQGNSWAAWKSVTPIHNRLVDTMTSAPIHVLASMRSKTEWVTEKNERTGKTEPRRVGLAPIMRDQIEFEFGIFAEMNQDNEMIIMKTRCKALTGGVYMKPGKEVADIVKSWLTDGGDEAQATDKPDSPSAQATPQSKSALPPATPIHPNPVVAEMLGRMKNDKFAILAEFQRMKKELVELLGDEGEPRYYELLSVHGVDKSDQFKKMGDAKNAAVAMQLAVIRIAESSSGTEDREDWLPSMDEMREGKLADQKEPSNV